jgi:hypothetical protein
VPTHWYPSDPDSSDIALGPLIPMEPHGVVDTEAWERDNPEYFDLLSLEEKIRDRVNEAWDGTSPD